MIPSIKEINEFIIKIAQKYTCPIKNPYVIEFATFGYCQREGKNKVFHTIINERNSVINSDKSEECKSKHLLLGNHKNEISNEISEYCSAKPEIASRAPLYVLKRVIESQTYLEIGGGIQLGFVKGVDFTLSCVSCKNMEYDKDSLQFRNIDILRENRYVGEDLSTVPSIFSISAI